MSSMLRVFLCCMLFSTYAFSQTPEEVMAKVAVLDDFLDEYGDNPEQNSFGAAKGVIENGSKKAYMGKGYWYTYADNTSSVTSGFDTDLETGEPIEIGAKNFEKGVDQENHCLHVNLTISTSDEEYPYAGVGCNLTTEGTYWDLSGMTSLSITAKGSGSVRVFFQTEDYEGENWGYYGADLDLGAAYETFEFGPSEIEPGEGSLGYQEDYTWAANGSKAVDKIHFQAIDDDVELIVDEIVFKGLTYGDFGWEAVAVDKAALNNSIRNTFSITNTSLNYSIIQPQHVTVGMFNAAGSQVANLFNGNANTGSHTVSLTRNNIAKGNYFIVVKGEEFSRTCPYTIVK